MVLLLLHPEGSAATPATAAARVHNGRRTVESAGHILPCTQSVARTASRRWIEIEMAATNDLLLLLLRASQMRMWMRMRRMMMRMRVRMRMGMGMGIRQP